MNQQSLLMSRSKTTCLRWLVVAVLAFCSACNFREASQITEGERKLKQGDYVAAEGFFSEAIAINPRSRAAHWGRAQAHQAKGEHSAALADYRWILESSSNDNAAREQAVRMLLELERADEAAELLPPLSGKIDADKFLELTAHVELLSGQADVAYEKFRRLYQANHDNTEALFSAALCQLRLGNYDEAEQQFSQYLEKMPNRAEAYWHRAKARESLKKQGLAHADRIKASDLDPRLTFAESSVGQKMVETLKGTGDNPNILRPLADP